MFDLNDILKGYSSEQYTEAVVCVMANFLQKKDLIDIAEFNEFYTNNLNNILNKIIERDNKINKEKLEALKMGD